MSDKTSSAGTVYLGVKLDDREFMAEMSKLAMQASAEWQKSLNAGMRMPTLDTSGITNSISSAAKDITKTLDGIGDMLYENLSSKVSDGVGEGVVQGVTRATSAASQFKMPKIKIELDEAHLREQISLQGQLWESFDNQRIAQAKKVARLTAEYKQALPGRDRDALQGQLAKEEERLVRLKMAASQADQQVAALERKLQDLSKPKPNPAAEAIKDIGRSTGPAAAATQHLGSVSANANAKAKAAVNQTTAATKRLGSVSKTTGSQVSRSMKGASRATSGLKSSMKKALRVGLAFMGIRSIYLGLRRAANSVTESFKRMAAQNTGFANTLNRLTQATDTLKGSFAAMVAPLVEAVAPALQRLVEWATEAFNSVAKLFAALQGKEKVMIAVGSTKTFTEGLEDLGDAAGGAQDANEKLKRSLGSFDEIEILHPKTPSYAGIGSGIGSGIGELEPGQLFEEVDTGLGKVQEKITDFFEVLKNNKYFKQIGESANEGFGVVKRAVIDAREKIKGTFDKVWPDMRKDLLNIGQNAAELMANWTSYISIPMAAGGYAAGVQIAASIVSGILEISASLVGLVDAMFTPFANSVNTFFDDHGEELKEKIYASWGVIGEGLSGVIEGVVEVIKAPFDALAQFFEDNAQEIEDMLTETWETIWEEISPIWDDINETAREIFEGLKEFFEEISGPIYDALYEAFGAAWLVIKPLWDWALKFFRERSGMLRKTWGTLWGWVSEVFGGVWIWMTQTFQGKLGIITGLLTLFSGIFTGDWDTMWEGIKQIADGAWQFITGVFESAVKILLAQFTLLGVNSEQVWEGIKEIFNGVVEFVAGVFTGDWERAWKGVTEIFGGYMETLKGLFVGPLNGIIDMLNWVIGGLNKIKLPDWMGGAGINIGYIERIGATHETNGRKYGGDTGKFAKGGIFSAPTLAYVGEHSKKEAVLPLERNTGWMDLIAEKVAAKSGGSGETHITMPIYLGTDTLMDVIELTVDREGRVRNKPVLA